MQTTSRRAFTLPELLIVIAIIGVLAALLMVSMSGAFRLSKQTRCASNLHYLYQALSLRRSDSLQSRRPPMKVTEWAVQVLPYIDFKKSVLICPASASASEEYVNRQGYAEDWDFSAIDEWGTDAKVIEGELSGAELVDLVELWTGYPQWGMSYVPFEPGPACVKLSNTQWDKAIGEGFLHVDYHGPKGFRQHDRGDFSYSADGNPNQYWLCFEHSLKIDSNYTDLMVHVTDNDDGTYTLSIAKFHCASGVGIVEKGTHDRLYTAGGQGFGIHNPSERVQLTVGEVQEGEPSVVGGYESTIDPYTAGEEIGGVGVAITNYGMNAQPAETRESITCVPDGPGKILLMGYVKILARATDHWSDSAVDPNGDGVPLFARHEHRVNVLFSDGAVRPTHPDEINPGRLSNRITYWEP